MPPPPESRGNASRISDSVAPPKKFNSFSNFKKKLLPGKSKSAQTVQGISEIAAFIFYMKLISF